MIQVSTPEEIAAAQAEMRALFAAQAGPLAPDANAGNALHLIDPELLTFRGRVFRVPPTSFTDGMRLVQLSHDMNSPVGHRRLMDFLWNLACPRRRHWWARLFRQVNPFMRASPEEIKDLLHFFLQAQTRSDVQYRFKADAAPVPTGLN